MQLQIKNLSLLSWLNQVIPGLWRPIPHEAEDLKPANMYPGCNRLPMEIFLECLCDGNMVALGTDPELAWVKILEEYYEIKGTDPGAEWYLNRDIIRLQNHLNLLQVCIDFLRQRFSEKVAASVRLLGYPFRPDPESDYTPLLDAIVAKSRTKFVTLQQLQKQYAERIAERKDNKPPSRDYFETLLVYIEEMQGTAYSFDTLMVSKFVTLEKKYWKQVDYLKNKN